MILGSFLTFLLLYKYVALFVIAFVAAFAFPLPASATLAAAGAFASQGYLSFPIVTIVAFLGNVAGDILGFYLARQHGEKTLRRIGFARIIHSKNYRRLRDYIAEFPHSVIYFTRFLTELGPAANLLAGLAHVSYKTFFIFDIFGEATYVFFYATMGYMLGTQWENNLGFLAKGGLIIVLFGICIYLIQFGLYQKRTLHGKRD